MQKLEHLFTERQIPFKFYCKQQNEKKGWELIF